MTLYTPTRLSNLLWPPQCYSEHLTIPLDVFAIQSNISVHLVVSEVYILQLLSGKDTYYINTIVWIIKI